MVSERRYVDSFTHLFVIRTQIKISLDQFQNQIYKKL